MKRRIHLFDLLKNRQYRIFPSFLKSLENICLHVTFNKNQLTKNDSQERVESLNCNETDW